MLSGYILTDTERKIEKMYRERSILTPSDLDIRNVASLFNMELSFSEGPQRAIWDEEFTVIFLNRDQAEEKQREVFFHELAHPLLHCGDQTKMSFKSFRELQENQANQFQLYAAIPFFMLKDLELPPYEYQMVQLIQNVFKVTGDLAKKRLEQIKRRIIQSKMDKCIFNVAERKEVYETMETYPQLEDLFSPTEIKQFFKPIKKVKTVVYFDDSNGSRTPLWYCIEFSRGQINWSKQFKRFPIDANLEFVSIIEFEHKKSDAPVPELKLLPSYPNDFVINMKSLKEKLKLYDVDPYNVRRFVIDVKELEHLLQLDIVSSKLQLFPAIN
ncbi:ImmA/IrrE family metallo-endopeptidase [Neobacillus sp. M.A.Huq-85]